MSFKDKVVQRLPSAYDETDLLESDVDRMVEFMKHSEQAAEKSVDGADLRALSSKALDTIYAIGREHRDSDGVVADLCDENVQLVAQNEEFRQKLLDLELISDLQGAVKGPGLAKKSIKKGADVKTGPPVVEMSAMTLGVQADVQDRSYTVVDGAKSAEPSQTMAELQDQLALLSDMVDSSTTVAGYKKAVESMRRANEDTKELHDTGLISDTLRCLTDSVFHTYTNRVGRESPLYCSAYGELLHRSQNASDVSVRDALTQTLLFMSIEPAHFAEIVQFQTDRNRSIHQWGRVPNQLMDTLLRKTNVAPSCASAKRLALKYESVIRLAPQYQFTL